MGIIKVTVKMHRYSRASVFLRQRRSRRWVRWKLRRSFDGQLCQEYSYQKLQKSDRLTLLPVTIIDSVLSVVEIPCRNNYCFELPKRVAYSTACSCNDAWYQIIGMSAVDASGAGDWKQECLVTSRCHAEQNWFYTAFQKNGHPFYFFHNSLKWWSI